MYILDCVDFDMSLVGVFGFEGGEAMANRTSVEKSL